MSIDDDRIEKLKRKLYSRTQEPVLDVRAKVSPKDIPTIDNWKDDEKLIIPEDMATSSVHPFLRKFLWAAGIFFVCAVAFAAYIFYGGGNSISSNNVDITVAGPSQIASGQEVDLNVSLVNQNHTDLNLVEWSVDYPDGSFADQDSSQPLTHTDQSIGTIASGATSNQTLKLFVFGNKGDTKTLTMTLKYQVAGSNAVFTKEKDYVVTIASSPLIVNVTAPTEINSGQDITFQTTVTSNSSALLHNVLLVANYPDGFTFESATPTPASGKNYLWNIGDLQSGDTKTISVTGKLVAQDGEQRTFQFSSGIQSTDPTKDIDTVLGQASPTVTVSKPFLTTTLALSGDSTDDSVAVNAGQPVTGELSFTNSLPDPIQNASVQVTLSGQALSSQDVTVSDGGFYQSSNGTISWDKNSASELATINPGDTENLSFSFNTLKLSTSAKNPEVDVTVNITGNQTSATNGVTSVTSSVSKKVLVNANLSLISKTLRGGPFTNTGAVPPKANSPTTYTVDWALDNTWNDVNGATVSATLPAYVDWTGNVSPTTENITYDADTRTVTWNPDSVSAGAGYTYSPREVFFQVKLNPSTSQVGSTPALTSQVSVSAKDDFTNSAISFSSDAVTTQTADTGGSGVVTN